MGIDRGHLVCSEQELHYRRFKALDMATETNFLRIIADHPAIFEKIENGRVEEMEKCLYSLLYHPLARMGEILHGEYKDYFKS